MYWHKAYKKKPMLAVLPRGCEHHAGSCTVLAGYTACCQSLWVPSIISPSSLCFVHYRWECSPQVSSWSSDSQGDSWHGLKVERVPSSSPLCVIFCAGPVVTAVFCRINGPHSLVHMCSLVSRSISVDREGCVPVSGVDSGVKHVFFVVLACWFKSSLFAATLSPCQDKHSKW